MSSRGVHTHEIEYAAIIKDNQNEASSIKNQCSAESREMCTFKDNEAPVGYSQPYQISHVAGNDYYCETNGNAGSDNLTPQHDLVPSSPHYYTLEEGADSLAGTDEITERLEGLYATSTKQLPSCEEGRGNPSEVVYALPDKSSSCKRIGHALDDCRGEEEAQGREGMYAVPDKRKK